MRQLRKQCLTGLLLGALFLFGANANAMPLVIDGDVIIAQDTTENYCALTFDDGPSQYTPRLLDMLAEYKIPATFFLVGRNAAHYPKLVRRIEAEGHEIGNHTFSHANLRKSSLAVKMDEIGRTDGLLRQIGVTPLYLRPPYGAFDQATENIARDLGLSLVLWSVDSKDWKQLPANYANLHNTQGAAFPSGKMRGVFLFHDIHERTVNDLPRIVAQLRAGGCERFVTIGEYMTRVDHQSLRMARRNAPHAREHAPLEEKPRQPAMQAFPAGTAPMPMARCSTPWEPVNDKKRMPQTTAQPDIALPHPQGATAS